MKNVDRLIEMALDFSELGLDDPYDPATHGSVVGQRVRVYVPSTTEHFWDVVQNGMYGIQHSKTADRRKANIFFEQVLASDRAHNMAYEENNHDFNGPVKPLIFVCEKKVVRLTKPKASLAAQIAAQAGATQTPMIDTRIQPRDLVGVVFPAEGNKFAYPIRKFVKQAKWGYFEDQGLPAPTSKTTGMKFGNVTPDDWQHVLIKYVQDLLNYSANYYDYLQGENQNTLYRALLVNAAKTGRHALMQFTPRQMISWVFSLLPPIRSPEDSGYSTEEDVEQVVNSTEYENKGRPFWMLYDKYVDTHGYDVLRGAKEPHSGE